MSQGESDATMGRNQSGAINRKTNTASAQKLPFESLDDVWVVAQPGLLAAPGPRPGLPSQWH